MVRPTAEYCSAVFHTMITAANSNELDRIQMQALKSIYGWRNSYRRLLEKSGLERLDVRRETYFTNLARKMSENARFSSWFPRRLYRAGVMQRQRETFKVYPARTERYARLPLNQMRRRLNEIYTM